MLENRVALVTGASRGIGAATAKLLAQHGAAVGVNYYSSEEAAQQVVDEIVNEGGKAIAIKADVREMSQVEAMVQQVSAMHFLPNDRGDSTFEMGGYYTIALVRINSDWKIQRWKFSVLWSRGNRHLFELAQKAQ